MSLQRRIEIWLSCKLFGHFPITKEIPLDEKMRQLLSPVQKVALGLHNRYGGPVYEQENVNVTACGRCGRLL